MRTIITLGILCTILVIALTIKVMINVANDNMENICLYMAIIIGSGITLLRLSFYIDKCINKK